MIVSEPILVSSAFEKAAHGFSVEDTMTDDSYFNIFEIKLSITSLFSVQIMSYLGVSDIIYIEKGKGVNSTA